MGGQTLLLMAQLAYEDCLRVLCLILKPEQVSSDQPWPQLLGSVRDRVEVQQRDSPHREADDLL